MALGPPRNAAGANLRIRASIGGKMRKPAQNEIRRFSIGITIFSTSAAAGRAHRAMDRAVCWLSSS
jgi:hypothetical protein